MFIQHQRGIDEIRVLLPGIPSLQWAPCHCLPAPGPCSPFTSSQQMKPQTYMAHTPGTLSSQLSRARSSYPTVSSAFAQRSSHSQPCLQRTAISPALSLRRAQDRAGASLQWHSKQCSLSGVLETSSQGRVKQGGLQRGSCTISDGGFTGFGII